MFLENEKEEKLKSKEKVKQESLKFMQMKQKEKEEQQLKITNEYKVHQSLNEERLRTEMEKEIQSKENLAKIEQQKNDLKANMHINLVNNPRRKKEDEIEKLINKNQQNYNDIQLQNQKNFELVRKQNLINARKVNEEIINRRMHEKEDYKKRYYERA